ncbi:hypothetical protein [Stackebrandtia soli]|uniref:hypothetical protein n=1 Tax=Stackebrandtia soli TaxID=1892856 RepID=UPI0039E93B77
MKTLTRRVASVILAGGLAVASLTGCGLIGGSAFDCAAIADSMTEVSNNIQADEATFQASVTKLREEAADITDAELKQAVEDYATLAEELNTFTNNPESADPNNIPDVSKATEMQNTFTEKCSAV